MQAKNRRRKNFPKIKLIKRQEMWTLTAQGWAIAIALIAYLIFFAITHVHSFLAVTSPIKSAEVLVVEGWLPDYAIQQALTEFKNGSYDLVITTGGSIEKGNYLSEYKSFAEVSAATFEKLGLESEKVVAVPTPNVIKDRSYASAAEFYRWLSDSNLKLQSVNVFSLDVHTRRSWLLFRKILTPKIQVGAIAARTHDYDPNKWWVSSQGVRTIIDEGIAYIYARFLNWKA
ncbi:YdcF family protein [Nostoc sp. UCD121]|uniref:ElyC/SanA/YdcF family protein n=1 Tax=unclassified Nostoc TaxID=2593658 RepID=UPI001627201F|nr:MULTISPECIES: ElyC/SanA/YdcF family protein [unclassified Nostoc]MBC1218584.1 YdcF family protein [Nostoc sp. UCD120]MBC1276039.1 YdcF family protein [Nostoc sp. UCD121]MBC1295317.1 YdcF family protein [Nostoc sp. UCD122]